MILSITYKEVFVRNNPSYSRSWWPEITDELEVNWVTTSKDGKTLEYQYVDGTYGHDNMDTIKSYKTRLK